MAIVKTVKGDLVKLFKAGAFEAIAHGCNTQNMMGAGIADQIHRELPEAFEADTQFHKRFENNDKERHKAMPAMGGELSVGHTQYGQVYNLYTQIYPGKNASYQLLHRAMQNLNKFCQQRSIRRVGVPLIGAGIGGLDIIAAMVIIHSCTPNLDVVVVVWDQDPLSWAKSGAFNLFEFPRKFDGAVMRTGAKDFQVKRKASDNWLPLDVDHNTALQLRVNRDFCISPSAESAEIFLVIDDKSQFEPASHHFRK